ncbi:MAG: bifunctional metallophosphatase/5'-nucleotidase, partial [Acholeplasmataceae bacterium]
ILENGSEMGLSRIGNLIIDERNENPDETVFITGGDILQGTLISNYFFGEAAIAALNEIGLDAFVIGNHEFDWGLDVVTEYFDPDTEGLRADFPLLGANVFYEGTREIPDFIDPYTIVNKGDLSVGIIGLMGYGLESSIATSRVEGYAFGDPLVEAECYSEYLRVEAGVDVVIVAIHDADDGFNQAVGDLEGNARVDAVFNGHTHQEYIRSEARPGVDLPVIQSGANGQYVGHLRLDLADREVSGYHAENLSGYSDPRLSTSSARVDDVLAPYLEIVEPLMTETIITAGEYLSRANLTTYMAELIRSVTDSDVAFHNYGGTRSDITAGEAITMSTLYRVFPFDNRIKTVDLTGREVKQLLADSYYDYHDIRPGLTLLDDEYYSVATNDYVFDYRYAPFTDGRDPIDTGILMRDVFYDVLVELALTEDEFYRDSPILLNGSDPFLARGVPVLGNTNVNGFRTAHVL